MRELLKQIPPLRWLYRNVLKPCSADHIRERIQRGAVMHFIGRNPGRALDLGCGGGLMTQHLAARALRTVAADYSVDNLACNRLSVPASRLPFTDYVRCDARRVPLRNAWFDTVLCSEVIEHIADHQQVEREIHRVLKPGGVAIVTVPHPPDPEFDPQHIEPGGHVREGYTLEQLRELFADERWELLDHDYCWLWFSRRTAGFLAWCVNTLHLRPPALIAFAAHLDRLCYFNKRAFLPGDLIVKLRKRSIQ